MQQKKTPKEFLSFRIFQCSNLFAEFRANRPKEIHPECPDLKYKISHR
nr:MAG TPA: hypothetical protein [Caudoviricetes sp.]